VRLPTGSLAAASARHPWRTLGAWTVVAVLAMVAIVLLLGGSLTTEGKPTNNPESERADAVRRAAFPSEPWNTTHRAPPSSRSARPRSRPSDPLTHE
jgi:hypothetical protein